MIDSLESADDAALSALGAAARGLAAPAAAKTAAQTTDLRVPVLNSPLRLAYPQAEFHGGAFARRPRPVLNVFVGARGASRGPFFPAGSDGGMGPAVLLQL